MNAIDKARQKVQLIVEASKAPQRKRLEEGWFGTAVKGITDFGSRVLRGKTQQLGGKFLSRAEKLSAGRADKLAKLKSLPGGTSANADAIAAASKKAERATQKLTDRQDIVKKGQDSIFGGGLGSKQWKSIKHDYAGLDNLGKVDSVSGALKWGRANKFKALAGVGVGGTVVGNVRNKMAAQKAMESKKETRKAITEGPIAGAIGATIAAPVKVGAAAAGEFIKIPMEFGKSLVGAKSQKDYMKKEFKSKEDVLRMKNKLKALKQKYK